MGYKTAVWHEYSVDPLELIGKTVRLTIIRRGVVTKAGSEASLSYYFGVVRAIAEPRGETTIDTFDGFQKEAFDFVFDGNYPEVSVFFQGRRLAHQVRPGARRGFVRVDRGLTPWGEALEEFESYLATAGAPRIEDSEEE